MTRKMTVGKYLLTRLEQAGARHIFGIPGDYVLGFYDMIVESPLKHVGACTEAGAAFAADAYARINGLGVVCVTYAVGGLNTVNAVAGAYAEKSPVVVISGAPGLNERARSPLLHHRVRDFSTQREVFEKITVCAVSIEDPRQAPTQIDATLRACMSQKRPVFIELPRDVVEMPCAAPAPLNETPPESDKATLAEALGEAAAMLRAAKRPAILAGVEIHRFNLQDRLIKLVEKTGFPVAATLLGKSVIAENHPQYIGVYEGAMGRESVRKLIEGADCLLILGAFMTDINLGVYTAHLEPAITINATSEKIAIKRHNYPDIQLRDFIDGLAAAKLGSKPGAVKQKATARKPFKSRRRDPLTIRRLFERINEFIEDDMIVICDIGDSLFGATDLVIHRRTEFLSPAYYTSMGFAVPAALGAQTARPNLRPLVFVGDGAFQMTGQEISSIARQGLNPIVIVLNNKGYTTERFINEGPYNDIQNWAYHRFTDIINAGWGAEVETEGQFEDALQLALKNTRSLSIINAHLEKYDRSEALERLGKRLSQQAGLAKIEMKRTEAGKKKTAKRRG